MSDMLPIDGRKLLNIMGIKRKSRERQSQEREYHV
jgi:hypothetical protein